MPFVSLSKLYTKFHQNHLHIKNYRKIKIFRFIIIIDRKLSKIANLNTFNRLQLV